MLSDIFLQAHCIDGSLNWLSSWWRVRLPIRDHMKKCISMSDIAMPKKGLDRYQELEESISSPDPPFGESAGEILEPLCQLRA